MLTVLPCRDEKIISKCSPQTENATVLLCKNADEIIGYAVIEQIKSQISIIGFELVGCSDYDNLTQLQHMNADIILRSVGSYALNRNVYYINCGIKRFYVMLKKFGFCDNQDKITINLKQLFKPCCGDN